MPYNGDDMDFQYKEAYNITDLIGIMRILRSPDGCPWDKVQTHESIRQNFIEETYEAVEAIDKGDSHSTWRPCSRILRICS